MSKSQRKGNKTKILINRKFVLYLQTKVAKTSKKFSFRLSFHSGKTNPQFVGGEKSLFHKMSLMNPTLRYRIQHISSVFILISLVEFYDQ